LLSRDFTSQVHDPRVIIEKSSRVTTLPGSLDANRPTLGGSIRPEYHPTRQDKQTNDELTPGQ